MFFLSFLPAEQETFGRRIGLRIFVCIGNSLGSLVSCDTVGGRVGGRGQKDCELWVLCFSFFTAQGKRAFMCRFVRRLGKGIGVCLFEGFFGSGFKLIFPMRAE